MPLQSSQTSEQRGTGKQGATAGHCQELSCAQWDSSAQNGGAHRARGTSCLHGPPHTDQSLVWVSVLEVTGWRRHHRPGPPTMLTASLAALTKHPHPWFLDMKHCEQPWCCFTVLLHLFRLMATPVAVHFQHRGNRSIETDPSEVDVHRTVKWQLLH